MSEMEGLRRDNPRMCITVSTYGCAHIPSQSLFFSMGMFVHFPFELAHMNIVRLLRK